MNDRQVYEEWKRQRKSSDVSATFADEVVANLHAESPPRELAERGIRDDESTRSFQSSLLVAATILLASMLGVARITLALFIGIQAH